jgi:hypothetical protein
VQFPIRDPAGSVDEVLELLTELSVHDPASAAP